MRYSNFNLGRRLMFGAAVAALLPMSALAQTADQAVETTTDAATAEEAVEDSVQAKVVVTGTLIRGIAPAGTNVIGLSEDDVKASGALSTGQLLATIPTVGGFNTTPVGVSRQAGSNGSNPINRPNLRNLPAANTSGGAQTLVMLDGHRVTPLGTQQLAVDPDFIAPFVISRVEAMTDGGSAVYGSDALGGVINFITRDSYDGLEVSAKYGFADNYTSYDVGGIGGKDWGSGSAYISYRYAENDDIFGRDRDFVNRVDPITGVPTGRVCANGVNVAAGSGATARTYTLSGNSLVQTNPLTCDFADDIATFPAIESHNVFGSYHQQLIDNVVFDAKFYYAARAIEGNNGTLGNGQLGTGAETSVTLQPTNPNYRPFPVGDVNFGLPQTVRFSLAPLLGASSAVQQTNLETWNFTPSFTIDMPNDWQARTLLNIGRGVVDFRNTQVNGGRTASPTRTIAGLAASGTLNPYNVTAANASAITAFDVGVAVNDYTNLRAIFDGPLFQLPAGEVRVAVGAEYGRSEFQRQTTNANDFSLLAPLNYAQAVKSVFGEVQVPILGGTDGGMEANLSVSGRYDEYDDSGNSFNPKVGLTFAPIEQLTFKANWGTSFNAPTPADQLGALAATAGPVPAAFLQFPPPTAGICDNDAATALASCSASGVAGIFLGGAIPGLEPQEAESVSFGFDFEPIDNFYFNASYYKIKLDGTLGRPVTGAVLTDFYRGFPDLWLFQPSGQQVAAILQQIPASGSSIFLFNPTSTGNATISLGAGPVPVQVLLDTRVQSLGETDLSGIDLTTGFELPTGFGSIDGRVSGNYRLEQENRTRPGVTPFDALEFDVSPYTVSSSIGATMNNLRAQATWNHTAGYDRSFNTTGQNSFDAFNSVNLFFNYDFEGEGLGKGLAVSLNVDNVLDEEPPEFKDAGQAGYIDFNRGRLVQIGVNKKF